MRLSKQIKYRDNLVKFIAHEDSRFTSIELSKIQNEINLMSNVIQMQESCTFKVLEAIKSRTWEGSIKQSKMNRLVDHLEKSQNL